MSDKKIKVELPAESNPKKADNVEVTISERVVNALSLSTDKATLVEKGEVESVVEVDGERLVVGNEEVL